MNGFVLDVVWVDGDGHEHAGFLSVHASRDGAEQAAKGHHRLHPHKSYAYSYSEGDPSPGTIIFQALGAEDPKLHETDYVITEVELQS